MPAHVQGITQASINVWICAQMKHQTRSAPPTLGFIISEAPPTAVTSSVKLLPLECVNKCWDIPIKGASGRAETTQCPATVDRQGTTGVTAEEARHPRVTRRELLRPGIVAGLAERPPEGTEDTQAPYNEVNTVCLRRGPPSGS
ncbi:hypothetical protein DPX16_1907 [Anabarilius grahami]|uniref:Uncharacterized protein n=1 Tax=Anabarilius grahami TaxID=495550 RepID=A0A3N0Z1X3_ANAGA|nr:hypothetical protein DPX16_1907 [Anabarilius grahami]